MFIARRSENDDYPVEILITAGMYKYFLTIEEAEKLKNEIAKTLKGLK